VRASIDRELHYPSVTVRHVGTVTFESVNDARAFARATIGKRTPATVGAPYTVRTVTVDDVDVLNLDRPLVEPVGTLAVAVSTDHLDLEAVPNIDRDATAVRYAETLIGDLADALPGWQVRRATGTQSTTPYPEPFDQSVRDHALAVVDDVAARLDASFAFVVVN
jgi:hypothetical protein